MNKAIKNIIWLASYPKSGNTWFRSFLTALYSSESDIDINRLWLDYHFASRANFDFATGLNSSELLENEIDELKPEVIKYLSGLHESKCVYVKVHENYRKNAQGIDIIPANHSKCAIYFIRNPLDVAVSFAYHNAWSIDKMIDSMNSDYSISSRKSSGQVPSLLQENLSSWSNHVLSWAKNVNFKVEIIRYEDMHEAPLSTFKRALFATGQTHSDNNINIAIEACRFDNLKKKEKLSPFIEKNPDSSEFFREGKIGAWRNHLSATQVKQIISDHQEVMHLFGYLDNDLKPVY